MKFVYIIEKARDESYSAATGQQSPGSRYR